MIPYAAPITARDWNDAVRMVERAEASAVSGQSGGKRGAAFAIFYVREEFDESLLCYPTREVAIDRAGHNYPGIWVDKPAPLRGGDLDNYPEGSEVLVVAKIKNRPAGPDIQRGGRARWLCLWGRGL